MGHVVLLGDSIFDNARYVPDRPPVIEQLRRGLPAGWEATLLAVDGNVTTDVARQLAGLPGDATHLFVSVGGNDALEQVPILARPAGTVGDALSAFHVPGTEFADNYRAMLRAVLATDKPVTVCTVYDAIPDLGVPEVVALELFNAVILREAFKAGVSVIDLRLVCDRPDDFSPLSPIEPSVTGGSKITRVIAEVATGRDARPASKIYV
jgi:hypothetical protein